MNAKARRLGLADSHFVRPDGLDAPGAYSSARDVTRSPRRRWAARRAEDGRQVTGGSAAAGRSTPGTTCSASFPGVFGVKTGHTDGAGWSQVAAVRRDGGTIYATILGSPSRTQRNADLPGAPRLGARRGTALVDAITRRAHVRRGGAAVRARAARARRRAAAAAASCGRAGRSRSGSSRRVASRCRCARGRWSGASRSGRHGGWSAARPLVAVPGRRPAGRRGPDRVVREADSPQRASGLLRPMIVTVTLNAAIDRTITVPNFQRGQRHRASAGLALAGGKGINVARALKTLGVPVVATGLAGGQTGTRIVERADGRGDPQRLRAHRGRVADLDRGRRPDRRHVHGDQRVGAGGAAGGARDAAREARYLTQGAELVVFAGSLPRDVADDFYAEAIHELARRQSRGARLRRRAAAARRRGGAVARLAEPARGGVARRPGVPRRRGLPARARPDRRARRAERDHHHRGGLLRAPSRGPRGAPLPGGRADASSPSRRSGAATCCWRRSSPPGRPAGRTRTRCGPRSGRAPRRRSSSAPAGSIRVRRTVSRPASR